MLYMGAGGVVRGGVGGGKSLKKQDDTNSRVQSSLMCTCTHKGLMFH